MEDPVRVLITTLPAKTHLYYMIPLAWSLHLAGHEVCVASSPDLVDTIERTGLTPVPVGEMLNLREMSRRPPRDPNRGKTAWDDIAETRQEMLSWDFVLPILSYSTFLFQELNTDRVIDDTVAFAKDWQPDLVIWDPMTFAGPIAARAVGAAQARMLWGIDLVARIRKIFLDFINHPLSDFWEDPLAEWLTRTVQRFGCDFDEELVVGQWTIDPMPSWMRFPLDIHYVPVRYVPFNGPAPIPRWAMQQPSRPRICLTLGLAQREVEGKVAGALPDMLEAVADLDVEVIATLNSLQSQSLSGAVPDNVRVVDFVPLSPLLPSCAAIIHHGGAGTFGNALVHGVPQFIVPDDTWDTVLIGEHVAKRGAGVCIPKNERSPDNLRRNLRRVLEEPSFRDNADRIRSEALATPGPIDIVATLECLTERHRRVAVPARSRVTPD
jgi:glycosyltransferase (activator-dependent family)